MSSHETSSDRNAKGQLREDLTQSVISTRLGLRLDGYRDFEVKIATKMENCGILSGCTWRPRRPQQQIDEIIDSTLLELGSSLPMDHPTDFHKAAIASAVRKLHLKVILYERQTPGKKSRQSVQPLQRFLNGPAGNSAQSKKGRSRVMPLEASSKKTTVPPLPSSEVPFPKTIGNSPLNLSVATDVSPFIQHYLGSPLLNSPTSPTIKKSDMPPTNGDEKISGAWMDSSVVPTDAPEGSLASSISHISLNSSSLAQLVSLHTRPSQPTSSQGIGSPMRASLTPAPALPNHVANRPLRDLKILVTRASAASSTVTAFMTVEDIMPADSPKEDSTLDSVDLGYLRAVLQDQIPAEHEERLTYQADERMVIHNNVLLRFAIKEAYCGGQDALRLHLGS